MKIGFLVLLLFLLLLVLPAPRALGDSNQVPHELPAATIQPFDSRLFLSSYGDTFYLASYEQFQDALSLLASLQDTELTPGQRRIVESYAGLARQVFNRLGSAQNRFDQAEILLSENRITEALQQITSGNVDLSIAEARLSEVESNTRAVGRVSGVLLRDTPPEIQQALDYLISSHIALRQYIKEQKKNNATQDVENNMRPASRIIVKGQAVTLALTPTSLSLTAPEETFVGDNITVQGKLTANSQPLTGREIMVYLNSEPYRVRTDGSGSYSANLTVPYNYLPSNDVTAIFVPAVNDRNTFEAARSPLIKVKTNFYTTSLEVNVMGSGYPGKLVAVNGAIESNGPFRARVLTISLDDRVLTRVVTGSRFDYDIPVPGDTRPGPHGLLFSISPDRRYAGTSRQATLPVARLPVLIDLSTSTRLILPGKFAASGAARSAFGPVQNTRVNLSINGKTTGTRTAADGTFTVEMESPADFSLIGPRDYSLLITPSDPWLEGARRTGSVLTVNPVMLSLVLGMIVLLGVLLARWRRLPVLSFRHRKIEIVPERQIMAITPGAIEAASFSSDYRSNILYAYSDGIAAVRERTTLGLAMHTTLREFFSATAQALPSVGTAFGKLTALAEAVLYSPRSVDEEMSAEARRLANFIRRELHL